MITILPPSFRYLSAEKKKLDDMTDVITTSEKRDLKHLKDLRAEMEKLYAEDVSGTFCKMIKKTPGIIFP